MNMSAADASFQLRPETFNGIRMVNAPHPFLVTVIDRTVLIAELAQTIIRRAIRLCSLSKIVPRFQEYVVPGLPSLHLELLWS